MKCSFKPRSLAVTAFLLMSMAVMAVPAKKQWLEKLTTDGTVVKVQLIGDEFGHWYIDAEGNSFTLTAEDILEKIDVTGLKTQRAARAKAVNVARRGPARVFGEPSTNGEYIGKKKGLVILVNFKDLSMNESNTQTAFDDQFNQVGYSRNGHIGSVHDYFFDQSYGKFDLSFDVVGPFTVSNNMSYYGSNDGNGNDKYPATMVAEAVKQADQYVNYQDYDWDGDGEVDQVFVVYAGYGEAAGAASNTIWPHEWNLESAAAYRDGPGALTLDGVTINTYACSSELDGTSGSKMDGIGTACHEFSHCLGLPDFYDTADNGNFGLDSWSLMDYGCYNGEGCVPCAYTAYERWYSGWMNLATLSETTSVKGMKAITDQEPEAYIIYNDANRNEYYILQNIQQESWNSEAYGHGLLVLHINYIKSYWENNSVNTSSTLQCCTIIPADNNLRTTVSSLAGDPYPGTASNPELTDTSRPASKLYNNNTSGRKYMSKPITDIAEKNGLIDFEFMKNVSGGGTDTTGEWVLLNNENMLESGMQLVIACNTENATAGDLESSYLTACFDTQFSSDYSSITSLSSSALVFTLGGSAGSWTFSDPYGKKLATTDAKKISLSGSNTAWKINVENDGTATIQYANNNSWGTLQYNSKDPRFTTYTSAQTPIQLYCRKVATTGVTLNKTELSMLTGDEVKLSASAVPSDATIQDLVWSSSDASVATVDNEGLVTAVSAGTAIITVKTVDGNFSASCSVSVSICPTYTVVLGDTHTTLTESIGRGGVILPERTSDGYTFVGWCLENVIEETSVTPSVIVAGLYHPMNDVTLYPVYSISEEGGEAWQLITDLSTVTEGEYALLSPAFHAFNGTITKGHGQSTANTFDFDDNGMASTAPSGTLVLTLTTTGDGFSMYSSEKEQYLYAVKAGSGNLSWHKTESSYWYWNVTQKNWLYDSNGASLRTYQDTYRTYNGNSNEPLYMARKVAGMSTFYVSLLAPHTGIQGDANDDGVVDVSDVTLVVSYVLGSLGEDATFVFEQANVASVEDNVVDVSDITAIVDIILNVSK